MDDKGFIKTGADLRTTRPSPTVPLARRPYLMRPVSRRVRRRRRARDQRQAVASAVGEDQSACNCHRALQEL